MQSNELLVYSTALQDILFNEFYCTTAVND